MSADQLISFIQRSDSTTCTYLHFGIFVFIAVTPTEMKYYFCSSWGCLHDLAVTIWAMNFQIFAKLKSFLCTQSRSHLSLKDRLMAEGGLDYQSEHILNTYRIHRSTCFAPGIFFSAGGRESRYQLAAKFNSVRYVNVQLACHRRLESPLLLPPSPPFSLLPPKGTLTDNERGNAGTARTQGGFN